MVTIAISILIMSILTNVGAWLIAPGELPVQTELPKMWVRR